MYFDRDSYQKSARSNYSALLNAAEYWGCEWTDIRDAEVWAVPPGTAVVIPKEFCGRN